MTHSADFLRAVHHNLCDMAGEMVRADMRLARHGEREIPECTLTDEELELLCAEFDADGWNQIKD
jgi:hypothetical protein